MRLNRNLIVKWMQILECLALGTAFWACSFQTAGTSEESEGIVALADKKISGAAQKGPLVKGSDVVLRETSADGSLEPTGREFTTKIINDKGEFKFDNLDLESQYVLISAEGYYTHERGESYYYDEDEHTNLSECPMRLDAVTNLEKRGTANVNILTHFEYKRVLNLVKQGKSFAEAKRQAATEVVGMFGVKVDVSSAEDLNIYNTTEADRILFNMSLMLDDRSLWDPWDGVGDEMDQWEHIMLRKNVDCSKLQKYLDGFTDDFADDGVLSDTIMQYIAAGAYYTSMEYSSMSDADEDDMWAKEKVDPGSYKILSVKKDEYEFSILVFLDYMGLERCTEDLWGEYRKFNRPIEVYDPVDEKVKIQDSGYFLCNGFYWEMKTKGFIDSLKAPIPHESGTMKDPRDGRKYKTLSFEFKGKKYEWMAEDLMYIVKSDRLGHDMKVDYVTDGLYSWTTAMQIDSKYMTKSVPDGLIDSLHQGICPDGWHVANTLDWEALLAYVGGINNLLDERWRTDAYTAYGKDLMGVFFNRFDFNLKPMDEKYLELYYNTYTHKSFGVNTEAELETLWEKYYPEGTTADNWVTYYLDNYRNNRDVTNTTLEISIGYSYATDRIRTEARVRCVKN